MTVQQALLMSFLYLVAFVAAIYFTGANKRRVGGSLVGGAVASLAGIGLIYLCESFDLFSVPAASDPVLLPLLFVGLAISLAPVYLITWRIERRFGWQGLAVAIGIVAVIGPPRDYMYAATFPEWMVFAPGVAPIVADSAAYVVILLVGHAVMRLVSGPAREDRIKGRKKFNERSF